MSDRGHSLEKVLSSIESRKDDTKRFIKPQSYADILISLNL